jgi:hypothetical protein
LKMVIAGITVSSSKYTNNGYAVRTILRLYARSVLGWQAIPQDWLYNLELTEEIIQIADDLLIGYRNDDEWGQKYPGW